MKISTKGKYAMEAILDLAIHTFDGHESLKNIAERRSISENYLEQIFVVLRRNGIVESIRGAQGGYKLAKKPDKITAGDIIRAVEGAISPVDCVDLSENDVKCEFHRNCSTRWVWCRMAEELNAIVDSVTIADLIESYRNIIAIDTVEYYI
jgi:Rrf2 family protein